MTSHIKDLFVPAGVDALTRCYDPALSFLMRERVWQPRLLQQIAPRPGERILDLGCGTGTLTIMLQAACPQAEIIGLDADREVLRIARAKARAAGTPVGFWQGRADDPSDVCMLRLSSFHKIVSCLLFHRLTTARKRLTLTHARGLLRPGGTMHIADWGKPANAAMRLLFYSVQTLGGISDTSDNVEARLPNFLRDAGFCDVNETHRHATVFGSLSFYRAVKG